jgi:hypothetical protein
VAKPSSEPGPVTVSRPERLTLAAQGLIAHPLFAYTAILLLEFRAIWRIWDKDITAGDTSYYYLVALDWAQHLHDTWFSPLYTNYFGTVLWFFRDVGTAVLVHRVLVIVGATLLVLAVARALLGAALGLLVAVWWTVVPANFNFDYEVHLFGFLPVVASVLVVAHRPDRVGRGVALGLLVGTMTTARNELVVAVLIFAAALVVFEIRELRRNAPPVASYAKCYGIPLLVAAVVTAGFLWQGPLHSRDLRKQIHDHNGLNMCQVYALNYQQRHPTKFTGNAFTDCAPLMRREFGKPHPTFFDQARANPRALADFLAWNLHLMPIGLQVALFGATSRGPIPGVPPGQMFRRHAAILTLGSLLVVITGIALALLERDYYRKRLRQKAWPILILLAVSLTAVVAALTEWPRAEYMYGLTLTLMLLTVACGGLILRRVSLLGVVAPVAAVTTLVLILALPSYYRQGPRPLHSALGRLNEVRPLLQRPDAVLVTSSYNFEICAYLAKSYRQHCSSPSWSSVQAQLKRGKSVQRILDDAHATVVYADPGSRLEPAFVAYLKSARAAAHWRTVESGADRYFGPWSVLVRLDPT